jgi:tetratricopeptide (TPR) repeat protein
MGFGFLAGLFYPWGLLLQATGDPPLHPAAAGHLLALGDSAAGADWGGGVSGCGGRAGYRAAARDDEGVSAPEADSGAGAAGVRQSAAGNYEELGDLYMEDGRMGQARAAFEKAIAARSDTLDAFYRRGVCALQLGDAAAAIAGPGEGGSDKEAGYDFYRAAGLLAHAYAKTGQTERAEALFRR